MIKQQQGQNICKFNGFRTSDPLPFSHNSVGYLSQCSGWYDFPTVSSSPCLLYPVISTESCSVCLLIYTKCWYFRDESHINTNFWVLYIAFELRKHTVPLSHEYPYMCKQNNMGIWSQIYWKPINNSDVWLLLVLVCDTRPWSKN